MVAASILPVTIHKGELYFLFGKENPKEDSAKGFSDFGGGLDPGETIYQTAMREGGEELTGFLGGEKDLTKLIKKNGGTFNIDHNDYHVHIFFMEYDENLPKYYNFNHRFLWERMDQTILNKSKLFEKIEIEWFSMKNMKRRRSEFRGFYQEIVDIFVEKRGEIMSFIKKRKNNRGKTNRTFNSRHTRKH